MALSGEKASAFPGFSVEDMLPKKEEPTVQPAIKEEKPEKNEKKQVKKPETVKKKEESNTSEPEKPAEGERVQEKKEPRKTTKTIENNILNIPVKRGHGVAKSVYFEDDNFAYIDEISKANEVKFSVILNLLIKQFREEHKK